MSENHSKTHNNNETILMKILEKNGKLISLDGDNYSEDKEIISYKEWYTRDIKNGLTVIVQGEWA